VKIRASALAEVGEKRIYSMAQARCALLLEWHVVGSTAPWSGRGHRWPSLGCATNENLGQRQVKSEQQVMARGNGVLELQRHYQDGRRGLAIALRDQSRSR